MLTSLAAAHKALTCAGERFSDDIKGLLVLATTHCDLAATVDVLRQQLVAWMRLSESFSVLRVGKSFHGYSMAHPWRMRQYPLAPYPPNDPSAANDWHVSQAGKHCLKPRELLICERLVAIVAV